VPGTDFKVYAARNAALKTGTVVASSIRGRKRFVHRLPNVAGINSATSYPPVMIEHLVNLQSSCRMDVCGHAYSTNLKPLIQTTRNMEVQ
jgi:hypothetical protein